MELCDSVFRKIKEIVTGGKAHKRSFDELWLEIGKLKLLPEGAIDQLPNTISENLKRLLAKREPEEVARILNEVIDEINHGSVERIETLTRRRLRRRR